MSHCSIVLFSLVLRDPHPRGRFSSHGLHAPFWSLFASLFQNSFFYKLRSIFRRIGSILGPLLGGFCDVSGAEAREGRSVFRPHRRSRIACPALQGSILFGVFYHLCGRSVPKRPFGASLTGFCAKWPQKGTTFSWPKRPKNHNNPQNPQNGPPGLQHEPPGLQNDQKS